MKTNVIRWFTPLIVVYLSTIPLVAASPTIDDWAGTWILNVQKSQYGQDRPPIDPSVFRQILKIRVSNGTLDLYIHTEMADGTDVADETHLLDLTGKPHVTEFGGFKPVTETFKQLDQNTIEITLKARPTEADGELTITVKLIMSADRKTIRETKEYRYKELAATGKSASANDPNPADGSILVFDRQSPN